MSDPLDEIRPTDGGARIAHDAPTEVAGGRYRIDRLLGRGGQKHAYLGRDVRLERDVVLSFLHADTPEEDARIRREAIAMGRLGDHPNIVSIYDIGEDAGRSFIVSQYIAGGSLDELRRQSPDQRLPIDQVLLIGEQVCRALSHAHRLGIVHRDLKPANIWLTKDRTAKLGDFGLAVGANLERLTSEGFLVGTVSYMAPERMLARSDDASTDLYSLGVILYELVTGRLPFVGDDPLSLISQSIYETPVAPSWLNPQVPRTLERLILQLLEKRPEDRPAGAWEAAEALVAISRAGAETPRDVPLLDRLAGGVFVGRDQEVAALRAHVAAAMRGAGRSAVLVGHAGSGKTRTAEQVLTYAEVRGARVLRGQCHEHAGAPAYWPWIQVLRSYVAKRKPEDLSPDMLRSAAVLAPLDPEIGQALPPMPAQPPLEPEQARFRLFDGITTFLKAASRERPLVIFLDDLHWADQASLLLLRFLVREIRDASILVLAAHRDFDAGSDQATSRVLADLGAQAQVDRVLLRGLSEKDIARFIELTVGVAPPRGLAAATYEKSDGNPFFVMEIVRLLVAEGDLDSRRTAGTWRIAIPDSVRDVVVRRLAGVSEETRRVLTVAAVVGREFAAAFLEGLSGLPADRTEAALSEAVSARVVTESREQAGVYRFSHAFVQDALYEATSATSRAQLHRQIGERLETLPPAAVTAHLSELAHHFSRASAIGGAEKAVVYAVRAAERASQLLAYEEAAIQYALALEALQVLGSTDARRRCEILLEMGDCQAKGGMPAQTRETFLLAARVAREIGAPALLARAALGLGSGSALRRRLGTEIDVEEVSLLREALDAVGPSVSETRSLLLAQLSLAHYHERDERVRFSQLAMDSAVTDRAKIAALYSRCVALEAMPCTEDRFEAATELVLMADKLNDAEAGLMGRTRRVRELLELGNVAGAREEVAAYARVAGELRQPRYLWYVPFFEAAMHVLRGNLGDVAGLVAEATEIGTRAQDPNLRMFLAALKYQELNLRGRFHDVEPIVKKLITAFPLVPGWRAILSRTYAALGDTDKARAEFERLATDDFHVLPDDGAFLVTLAALSYTCWRLQDARRGARLYELLLPYQHVTIVTGNVPICGGAVSQYLGLCATAMSAWDEGVRHFEQAIALNGRMGSRPYVADTKCGYATMLIARGRDADLTQARALLTEARSEAHAMGMSMVAREAEGRLASSPW